MTTTTRPAHLSAVRIGKGTAVHAGHLSTYGTDDAPRYIPLCPAGAPRFRADDSPAVPAHGASLDDRVTCRNCVARYAHAVGTIHAAQDAAHAAPEPAPVPVHPASINSADGVHDGLAAAVFVWGIIVGTPGRLRAAWVNAAQRRVHGLPDVAHDGRSTDADVARACEADIRDADGLAREYLAAYAAVIDDRADAVDRTATRYAAPDDAVQESTGIRPPAGAMVTVEGHAGRWEILPRSAEEQRRHPHRVRVRQEGHTFNGSVPLDAVTVCPPDTADGSPFAWQTVQTGIGQDADGVGEWPVYAVDGGAYVGELWRNSRGVWSAYRRGHGATTATHATRADALTSVGWLDTVAAADLCTPAYTDPRIVLSDGYVFAVHRAKTYTDWPGGKPVPMVALTGETERAQLWLRRPVTPSGVRLGVTHTLRVRAAARVALVPPRREFDTACSPSRPDTQI
jgi:hypothetical protein